MEHVFHTTSHGMVIAPATSTATPCQQPQGCTPVIQCAGFAWVACFKGLLDAAQQEYRRLAGSSLPAVQGLARAGHLGG